MANGIKETDYKKKYNEMKSKLVNFVDLAFQQGYQQGQLDAQAQQIQQQQQELQMQQQAQMQQEAMLAQASGQQGQPQVGGPEQPQGGEMPPEAGQPTQEELEQMQAQGLQPEGQQGISQPESANVVDQYLEEIESLVNKSDFSPTDLQKSLSGIVSELKKAKTFGYSQSYIHNLPEQSKKSLSMQEKILEDVMKSFDAESQAAALTIDKAIRSK